MGETETQPARTTVYQQQERTLRSAWLISLMAPAATAVAFMLGGTSVQLADFFRRSAELLGLFASWWVLRRIHSKRSPTLEPETVRQLEHRAALGVGVVMVLSATFILVSALLRLADPPTTGLVAPGLVVPLGGMVVNGWFWRRGSLLARQHPTPLVDSQWRLCRAKAVLDGVVFLTLLMTLLPAAAGQAHYIDTAGALSIAVFLLISASRIIVPASKQLSRRL